MNKKHAFLNTEMPRTGSGPDAWLSFLHDNPQLPWTWVGWVLTVLEDLTNKSSGKTVEDWVRPLNLKRASAWRYRGIALRYDWLYNALKAQNIQISEHITELDPKVNPEKIEILMRLTHATEPTTWLPVANAVFFGSISLREIRSIWRSHRPVLDGKTARRRSSPGFVEGIHLHDDKKTQAAREKGLLRQHFSKCFMALLEQVNAPAYGNVDHWGFYALEPPVALSEPSNPRLVLESQLDAVIRLRSSNVETLAIHGLLCVTDNQDLMRDFSQERALVDVLWIAGPEHLINQLSNAQINAVYVICDRDSFYRLDATLHGLPQLTGAHDMRLMRWLLNKSLPALQPVQRADHFVYLNNWEKSV